VGKPHDPRAAAAAAECDVTRKSVMYVHWYSLVFSVNICISVMFYSDLFYPVWMYVCCM